MYADSGVPGVRIWVALMGYMNIITKLAMILPLVSPHPVIQQSGLPTRFKFSSPGRQAG